MPAPRYSPISPTIVCGPTATGARLIPTAFEIASAHAAASTTASEIRSGAFAW
jgi:hypothetical protein